MYTDIRAEGNGPAHFVGDEMPHGVLGNLYIVDIVIAIYV